jgi:predicted XRE-type DNA-binding protein
MEAGAGIRQTSVGLARPGNHQDALPGSGSGTKEKGIEMSKNVWDDICDTPEEAGRMKILSALMLRLDEFVESQGWDVDTAAAHMGVSTERMADFMAGKISRFDFDSLVDMATAAGMEIDIGLRLPAAA